ncbi:type II toxin-antitoxin system RelE/ParE family toxin [Caulobacter hibisci]|uniref:Type II toxin-antitoxin system RelE/ParE family toxin n=1 Tax=Caulobacter hibisci TaxID=2035993 RepID=A0ABS0T1R1_9CAUL|nr:type II toxin-antitoxin system RelE/ParE family toxin [Caulobacter hibisci]MBI1685811.1 type II toxin-antitoxin system RelE/ParE family toxin [Caulobacter hibisci]
MAGFQVVRSAEARRDLRVLYVWIATNGGQERAEAVVARIETALSRLARRPLLGRLRPDFANEPRAFSVRPWLIVYRPLPDGAGVRIVRILDSRQDTAALMGKKS